MTRRIAVLAIGSAVALSVMPAGAARPAEKPKIISTPVSFRVVLSQDGSLPGPTYIVRGYRYSTEEPSPRVALLLHGLSYGYWAWDFPRQSPDESNPYLYSTARYLAASGVDAVAIDELGYGSSDIPAFPDSRLLTIPAYANMAHQIVTELRASYTKVAIVGHSAGAEMASFEAGRYQDVDALVDLGMADILGSPELVADVAVNNVQGFPEDYVWFGENPLFGDRVAERTRLMYEVSEAEAELIAQDNAMANKTPSMEIQSITLQPARAVEGLIRVPVLVAFGSKDALFPPPFQTLQPLLYPASPSVSTFTLTGAGHTLMLHRNAGQYERYLADWLRHVFG